MKIQHASMCFKFVAGSYLEAALEQRTTPGRGQARSHLVNQAQEFVGGYRLEGFLHTLVDLHV